ncbi:MAG: F0F1 ATP synthase subunit gamma [Muribaculaceae bacterium]|nr:F0F1 ATP synthase subunit gamma [Muribaculaceae bacterium]
MATLRDLKGRIGSVSSSEKITGAMKMISSAKMSKATREIKRPVYKTHLRAHGTKAKRVSRRRGLKK